MLVCCVELLAHRQRNAAVDVERVGGRANLSVPVHRGRGIW
jgi:hypothetical protein